MIGNIVNANAGLIGVAIFTPLLLLLFFLLNQLQEANEITIKAIIEIDKIFFMNFCCFVANYSKKPKKASKKKAPAPAKKETSEEDASESSEIEE